MNKKFSTLVAGVLLATAFSANAQYQGPVDKLPLGNSGKLYQLGTNGVATANNTDSVLVLNANGEIKLALTADANLGSSLWCVTVGAEANGQNPIFDFANKAQKMNLAVSIEDTAAVVAKSNGNIAGWKFSSTYKNSLEGKKYLASYYTEDSVVVLVHGTGDNVILKHFAANDVTAIEAEALAFTLYEAEHRVLTANDFNTKLDTQIADSIALTFTPNYNKTSLGNPFTDRKLKAVDVIGQNYVYMQRADNQFLRVDTAYANSVGEKFLTFAFGGDTTLVNNAIAEQYKFQLTYCPTSDSLYINVKEARYNLENSSNWAAAYASQHTSLANDSTFVKLQDLVSADEIRIVTIGKEAINTKIALGLGGCSTVDSDYSSLANDLYTIQNSKGQYLVMPIYGDTTIMWVTKEKNVDPTTMPSYQWIVEKTRLTDKDETSPIRIYNREFVGNGAIAAASLQLYKGDKTAVLADDKGVVGAVNLAGFTAMSKEVKANKYLGYKHVDKDEATVTVYTFNYLHDFDNNKYMGTTDSKTDSLLYVGGKTSFELVPQLAGNADEVAYGAYSAKVSDLARLVRTSYVLKVKDGMKLTTNGKVVVVDDENRYSVATSSYVPVGDSAIFYLKANNRGDETHTMYYALVDTNTVRPEVIKGGVDDNNLWVKTQTLTETRTSAFAIERNEDPLYRRFNTLDEGTVANDNPDTLKFFRTNNPSELLYEDAYSVYSSDANGKSLGVNFLGVNNKAQISNTKYAIYADTAYVDRGTGYIKPQYMLAVGVNVQPGGYYCPIHGWNPTCAEHAEFIAGYVRGRYLINATDSASVKDEKYLWNHKWNRLAFVDAIHRGDSLYILKDEFEGIADKDVDFVKLNASSNSANVYDLSNNLHKDVVFSFRLIDSKTEKDFLIESETARTDANGAIVGNRNEGPMIAPVNGGWIKIQNGVPVISRGNYTDAIADAEIFNVVKTDETPVTNEGIETTEVSVIAANGSVIIDNAAGKKVAISNILGQTIANTVITSDNATISIPAGIVVVAVEGEAAVKVMVK